MLGRIPRSPNRLGRVGNIGKSLLSGARYIEKTHLWYLELSSYMLHYLGPMHWSPTVRW